MISHRSRLLRRLGQQAWPWAAGVLAIGLTASLIAAVSARNEERQDARALLDRRAAVAGAAITAEGRRYTDTVAQLAASLGAGPTITAARFARITAPLAEARLAGASGVLFVVPATTTQIPAVQRYWRRHGAPSLTFAPGNQPGHLFTVFDRALDGRSSVTGRDLSTAPQAARALSAARQAGSPIISDAYVLLKDRTLPAREQQQSFSLTAPVYGPAVTAGGPGPFLGWIVMGMRGRSLALTSLRDATQGLVDVTLVAASPSEASVAVATVDSGRPTSPPMVQRVTVPVAQQTWTLTVQNTVFSDRLRFGYIHVDTLVALGGSLLSAILTLLVWSLLSARRRALARVDAATVELRAAESRARQQAGLLEAIMNSLSDGVRVMDGTGTFLLNNRAALEILGSAEPALEPTGPERYGLFRPDGRTPFPKPEMPLHRALAGENADHVDVFVRSPTRPDGVMISINARPLDEAAGVRGGGAVAVFRDVTESRRLAAELQEQHDRHERLLRVLSDLGEGVVITEAGRFVYANDAYVLLTGYPLAELLAMDPQRVAADDDARADFTRLRRELDGSSGPAGIYFTSLRHHDGHVVPVETTGINVEHEGRMQRVCMVRDLTERRTAQAMLAERAAELERANRQLAEARDAATAASMAKSDFVAMMSHEIRTPLNGVIGLNALLLDSELNEEQRDLAETAGRSGEALLTVINDILDFSKMEAGKLKVENARVDLPEILHDIADLFAAQAAAKRLELLVDQRGCPDSVKTDPMRLRQVLGNLVGNAVKFTASGHVTISARVDAGRVALCVSDSGEGIPAEAQSRLFSAFEQADGGTSHRFGGTGLGLTISRRLAVLLGGDLTVQSSPGAGSTFTLTLPTTEVGVTAGIEPPGAGPRQRILLVCGSTPLREHLRTMLQAESATVIAPPGSRWPLPDPGHIDVAIVDTRGDEQLRLLPALARLVPVIALTPRGVAALSLPPGVTVVTLPVRRDRLRSALHAAACAPAQGEPPPDGVPRPRPGPGGLRVLVAEDDAINQRVTSALLVKLGHVADVVRTGRDAVDAAQLIRYDAILMDCHMPELDGWAATAELRGLSGPDAVAIIGLTASLTAADRDACRSAGMDSVLSKPVRLSELMTALDAATRLCAGMHRAAP